MFSENKKERKMAEITSNQNIIGQGSKFVGNFESQGDFRIDGEIEGDIVTSGKVVLGKSGVIKGALTCKDAYFEGKFNGKLTLSGTLTLKSSAHIEGDVFTSKLSVEPGAVFNVNCVMKSVVKEMNHGGERKQKNKKTA